jgi:hypothetical protein
MLRVSRPFFEMVTSEQIVGKIKHILGHNTFVQYVNQSTFPEGGNAILLMGPVYLLVIPSPGLSSGMV